MNATLHLHLSHAVAPVDPRIFGGFLEHLGRAVYEGVYEPNSKHADEKGCRRDVLEALRRLRFTAMRYPGGNFVSGYHWQDGVGPREGRPPQRDLAWQSLEPNAFGPNEFLELCPKMGWTPMLAVNLGTGTPEEARQWLEYCNLPVGTKFPNLRAEHGYADPWNVKLWCLGNEMDGAWQIGHVPASQYAIAAQQTALMMKMVDPTVEVVACGSCAPSLPTYLHWDRAVLEHCGASIDYLSLHRYVGNESNDTPDFLACLNSVDEQIEATAALTAYVQKLKRLPRRVGIAFDEWNVWYRARTPEHSDGRGKFAPHLLEEVYNLEDALVAAGFLNSFIRHADSVKIANIAQIVNVIAPILTRAAGSGDDLVLQTIFYPIEMIASRGSGTSLRVIADAPTYESKQYGTASHLDASAILNGNHLSIFAVNRSLTEAMELTLDVNKPVARLVSGETIYGTDPKAANTFEDKRALVASPFKDISICNGTATLKLPPLSVTAVTVELIA